MAQWVVTLLFALIIGVAPWIKDNYGADRYSQEYSQNETSPITADDRIADYNFWLTVITGALAVIAMFQIWFLARSDKTARISADAARDAGNAAIESNRINREAMIADQRPWVSVIININAPLTWNTNGANFSFNFILENTGRTPALKTVVDLTMFPDAYIDEEKRQKEFAESVKNQPIRRGFTLFPNKPVQVTIGTNLGQFALDARKKWWMDTYSEDCDWINPLLVGNVTYGSAFNDLRHQTGFIRQIVCAYPENNSVAIGPSVGDIPIERLLIRTSLVDGITD